MKEGQGLGSRIIFAALLLIVLSVSAFCTTVAYAGPLRQMMPEESEGDGTLLSYVLTFASLCLIGIACLFFGCLVKFDNHSSTPKFYSTCFQIAKDEAGMFAGLAFIISIPFVSIPIIAYFIVLTIISKEITIEGVIAAAAVGYFCAIVVVLRKVLRDIKADTYFKNIPVTSIPMQQKPPMTDAAIQQSKAQHLPAVTKPTDSATDIELVFVKGGCFDMGDTFGDGSKDEKPVHEVCLSDFYIGKYQVTQGQWKKVMGSNPSYYKHCGDNRPVENVSWNDAQEFIRKLNSQSGKNYRLPTEAEWEYAARSGGKKEKWAGTNDENELGDYAWHVGNCAATRPVGQKKPNGLGIYDMCGNVDEWCSDWYGARYYGKSPRDNPQRVAYGTGRVIRGGSCGSRGALNVRASKRDFTGPHYPWSILGFRLVAPAIPPPNSIETNKCTEIKEQGNETLETFQGLTAVEWFNKAYALSDWDDKEPKKAIEYFSNAIKLKPDDAEFYIHRGRTYEKLGKYQFAINDYSDAIRLEPDDASAYDNRGGAYSKLGQYQLAIEDYTEAIRLDPDEFDVCVRSRGEAYSKLAQYKRAIKDYNKAIRQKPNDANAYVYRGEAYSKLGQYERAIKDYNFAIRQEENDANAYYHKACCFALQKKAEQACEWLQLAIERGYNDWQHIKQNQDFDKIRKDSCFINLLEEAEKENHR